MYMHYSLCCMDYYKYVHEITIKVLCMCIRMHTNMNEWLTVKLYVYLLSKYIFLLVKPPLLQDVPGT